MVTRILHRVIQSNFGVSARSFHLGLPVLQQQHSAAMSSEKCIFCKICRGESPETKIFYQDDEFTVFNDHKPATPHHYLVCTKQHISDPKALKKSDIGLVERMMNVGMQVLQERDGDTRDVRMGFHWPPFTAVSHLHLHVISPQSRMGLISKAIFMQNSYWFVSVKWLMDHLSAMEDL